MQGDARIDLGLFVCCTVCDFFTLLIVYVWVCEALQSLVASSTTTYSAI